MIMYFSGGYGNKFLSHINFNQSDGLLNCLCQPGLLPYSFWDDSASETKSTGLQAEAHCIMPARPKILSLEQILDKSFGWGYCSMTVSSCPEIYGHPPT